jgi:hypothetical protein
MVDFDDFIVKEDAIEKISDEEILMEHLESGKPLQEIFGFSNETTVEFYEAAKNILEQKRYEDAIDAFTFLTTINPYMADFWMGLGMAQQNNNEHDAALFSYSIGYTLEGGVIFPYVLAAQCCMEIRDFERALEVIGNAETYAEENADKQDTKQLKADAAAAKNYILQQQRRG